jgi:anti-sigma factor RsiW
MTGHPNDTRLGDYVDGMLADADAADLDAHLAACVRCRTLIADLQTIRTMARSLEPYAPPPRVWHHLSQAIQPAPRWSSIRAFVLTWQPAAATAMVTVLAAGLWWIGDRLSAVDRSAPPGAAEPASRLALGDLGHGAAEARYSSTIASLEALAEADRGALDPMVADVLADGLYVIDAAIDQSRAAVRADPDSEAAQESLFQALRTKVDLLRETLTVASDRRPEMAP